MFCNNFLSLIYITWILCECHNPRWLYKCMWLYLYITYLQTDNFLLKKDSSAGFFIGIWDLLGF